MARNVVERIPATRAERSLAVVRWSLIALAIAFPWATSNFTFLAMQPYPWTANMFELPKLLVLHAGLTVATIAWAVYLFAPGARVRANSAQLLLAGAAVFVMASTLLSGKVGISFVGRDPRYAGALMALHFCLAAFLATQCLNTHESRREFARALVGSSAVLAVYVLLQAAGLDPVMWGQGFFDSSRPSATFGNPTILGGSLVLPFALSMALALGAESDIEKAGAWIASIVLALAMLVTFTRSAWIGAAAALITLVVVVVRSRSVLPRTDRRWLMGAAAVLLLAVLLSIASPNADTNVVSRIVSALETEGSGSSRIEVWRTAATLVGREPLVGVGPVGFGWAYRASAVPSALAIEGVGSYPNDAHSYPLQLASTLGLPAALLLLSYLGLIWYRSGRTVFARNADPGHLLLAGYWGGTLGLFAHSMFSVATSYLVFLWIGVGVLTAAAKHQSPRALTVARLLGTVTAVGALISLWLVLGVVRADSLYMRGLMSAAPDDRITALQAAIDASSIQDLHPRTLGSFLTDEARRLLTAPTGGTQIPSADAILAQEYLEQGERAFEEARARAPQEPDTYYGLGWLHLTAAAAGDADRAAEADRVADEGLIRAPNWPGLLALKARTLLATGDVDGGLTAAEEANRLFPDTPEVLTALGEALLAAGDSAGASAILEEGRALAPEDPWVAGLAALLEGETSAP